MADYDIHYDPITVHSDTTVNNGASTHIFEGLDAISQTFTLQVPQPVKSEVKAELIVAQPFQSRTELAVTEPVKVESKAEVALTQAVTVELAVTTPIKLDSRTVLDVQPIDVDQCLKIGFQPLPPTCVKLPYAQRFGVRLFGVEILGFELNGESRVVVNDEARRPYVALGGEESFRPPNRRRPTSHSDASEVLRIQLG